MASSSPSAILSRYTVISPRNEIEDSSSQLSDEDNDFCNDNNIQQCTVYLNQELESFGINSIICQHQPISIVQLLNTVYSLVQYNRSTAKKMDDITNSLLRSRSDLSLRTDTVTRLKMEEKTLQKCISLQKETERQLTQRNKTLATKLKIEKEEVRRLQQSQHYEEQKYLHSIKKKDREYTRLKDRLGELVLNKSQERKLGIKTLNVLQKHRKTWNTTRQSAAGEDMYKLVMSHYEEREKELMLENSSLRESLYNMEKELTTLLNDRISDYHNIAGTDNNSSQQLMDSGCFRMPFEIIREDIEQNLRIKYQKLRDRMTYLKERTDTDTGSNVQSGSEDDDEKRVDNYETEIDELMKQLNNYQEIITHQEELIVKSIEEAKESEHNKGISIMSPSHILRKIEDVEKKESRINEREMLIIDNERKLMEATRNLDRERHDFEDQKGKFYKQQFLESSIFVTPSRSGPTQIHSFFNGLSSTPFVPTTNRRSHNGPYTKSSSGSSYDTPNKENIVFGSPVLRNKDSSVLRSEGSPVLKDISLSSDDGIRVINDDVTN